MKGGYLSPGERGVAGIIVWNLYCLDSPKLLLHPCQIPSKMTTFGGSEESKQHYLELAQLHLKYVTHKSQCY